MLLEFCNANLAEIKEVAFESFIKIQFLFLRNISYLCGNPTKEFKDFRIGEVVRNCSDYSLAKEVLYFEPKKEFYEGICELYSWIKETEFE